MKLRIEKAIYGGAGLARLERKAIFVPFALPGEWVDAHIVEEARSYATAELDAVLEPSPSRVSAPCPFFGACGGCQYQQASYEAQTAMKAAILRETLERAHLREIPEIAVVSGPPFEYRNRIRLHVQSNPFALGYRRRNTHALLPVTACPIAAPALQQGIEALSRAGAKIGLGAWAREMDLFVNHDASALLLSIWTDRSARDADRMLSEAWPRLQEILPALVGTGVFAAEKDRGKTRLLAHCGEESLHYPVGEHAYRISLGSFFQVNRFLVENLVVLVTQNQRGATAWDLYAGVGLFSLPLTRQFEEVVAVESAPGSVRDLRDNLQGTRSRVVAADTAAFLRHAREQRRPPPDLVVVDPPRAGLGREVTSLLAAVNPRNVTYVSCDPATLSRDLAALLESGYRLRKLHLVDLFPQTFHLESVAHLSLD